MAAEARLPLLGNVAQHRATLDDHDITQLNVVPCISVPSEVAAARAQDLWTRTIPTKGKWAGGYPVLSEELRGLLHATGGQGRTELILPPRVPETLPALVE